MNRTVFPLGLHLEGKTCLVIGRGMESAERADALRNAGATVVLQSREPTPELRQFSTEAGYRLDERDFTNSDLDEVWLCVLTDRDTELAERVARACRTRRLFFCAVDMPDFSEFSHLAVARSGDVVIAVSTSGRVPALSRRLRQELQRLLDASNLRQFVDRLSRMREAMPRDKRATKLSELVSGVRLTGTLIVPDDDT